MDLPRLNISTPDLHTTPPERHTIAVSTPTAQRKPFFDGIFDSPKRQSTGSLGKPKVVTVDKTPLMSANDFLRSSQVTEDYQIESRSSQNTDYNYYPGGGADDTTRLNDYPPLQIGDNKESIATKPDSDAKSHRRISSNYTYTATSFPKTTINTNRFSSSERPPSTSFYSNPLPLQFQNTQSARSSYISNKRLSSQKLALAYLDGLNNVMVPSGLPNVVVRVERDYTRGDGITQFEKTFPAELEGRVTREQFDRTITTINDMLRNAEKLSYNCFDNLMECLTIYTWSLCCSTHYQRSVQKIVKFIETENKRVYNQEGLQVSNPIKTAWLFLEFELL